MYLGWCHQVLSKSNSQLPPPEVERVLLTQAWSDRNDGTPSETNGGGYVSIINTSFDYSFKWILAQGEVANLFGEKEPRVVKITPTQEGQREKDGKYLTTLDVVLAQKEWLKRNPSDGQRKIYLLVPKEHLARTVLLMWAEGIEVEAAVIFDAATEGGLMFKRCQNPRIWHAWSTVGILAHLLLGQIKLRDILRYMREGHPW